MLLRDVVFPFVASGVIFFLFLGHQPMGDWDEAIYGDIAREFVSGASRLIPYWNFHPWLERTPLFEWITAIFFALFGVNEFWARAASALASAGTALVVYLMAKEIGSCTLAWLAAAILVTTHSFFFQSRVGTTDAMLTLWMTVSLYGIYRITEGNMRGWYLFWVGLALGVMTKSAGPAPVVLTLLVVLGLHRRRYLLRNRQFLIGLSFFVILVAPWHVYMFVHFGRTFFDEYVGRQILERSVKSLEAHRGGPFFYVIRIAKGAFPWSLLLLPAILAAVRRKRLQVVEWYAIVLFVFYTCVRTKLPWYIVPFYPALAILAAQQLIHWIPQRKDIRAAIAAGFVAVALSYVYFDVRAPYGRPEVLLLKRQNQLREHRGVLILCSDSYILDSPAPLFYAGRPVVQAFLKHRPDRISTGAPFDPATNDPKFRNPQPLSEYVSSQPQLILVDRNLLPDVERDYRFRAIASSAQYELGVIRNPS